MYISNGIKLFWSYQTYEIKLSSLFMELNCLTFQVNHGTYSRDDNRLNRTSDRADDRYVCLLKEHIIWKAHISNVTSQYNISSKHFCFLHNIINKYNNNNNTVVCWSLGSTVLNRMGAIHIFYHSSSCILFLKFTQTGALKSKGMI